jgi:Phage integrase family
MRGGTSSMSAINSSSTNPSNPSASASHAIASLTSQIPKRRNGRTDNGRFILFRIKDHSIASEAPGRAFRSHLRRRRAKADPLPDMSGIPDDCCAAHRFRLPDLPRRLGESSTLPFAFVSERGPPFCKAGFARMIERAAVGAGLELKAHPHMLRHACGYALANKGHDTGDPRVAGASVDQQHGRLHGGCAEPVQGLLARLMGMMRPRVGSVFVFPP